MILFKCKCGCFFSIKENTIVNMAKGNYKYHCQNCDSYMKIGGSSELSYIKELSEKTQFKISIIPDNAEISVDFKV